MAHYYFLLFDPFQVSRQMNKTSMYFVSLIRWKTFFSVIPPTKMTNGDYQVRAVLTAYCLSDKQYDPKADNSGQNLSTSYRCNNKT